VLPGVFIGARLDDRKRGVFAAAHPRRLVLDLTGDFNEAASLREGDYVNLQLLDLTEPPPDALRDAAATIEMALGQGKTVFVHCTLGYSRSAHLVAHWLTTTGRAHSLEEAFTKIRAVRPGIVIGVIRRFPRWRRRSHDQRLRHQTRFSESAAAGRLRAAQPGRQRQSRSRSPRCCCRWRSGGFGCGRAGDLVAVAASAVTPNGFERLGRDAGPRISRADPAGRAPERTGRRSWPTPGLYLPLLLLPGVSAAAVVALVLLALLSEFCGVLGVQIGASRRYDGPMGKSDRALLLGGYRVAARSRRAGGFG
jgi:hypothetical protein